MLHEDWVGQDRIVTHRLRAAHQLVASVNALKSLVVSSILGARNDFEPKNHPTVFTEGDRRRMGIFARVAHSKGRGWLRWVGQERAQRGSSGNAISDGGIFPVGA